jgi:hypothetical protein
MIDDGDCDKSSRGLRLSHNLFIMSAPQMHWKNGLEIGTGSHHHHLLLTENEAIILQNANE